MTRKERRELRKDKNLITELYSIIKKYLPDLLKLFENLTDVRNQAYITYSMKTICVTRLFALLCGIISMTEISSDKFNTEECINNLSKVSGKNLEELPYWETIQDVFFNMKIEELRKIQKYIVIALLRSKMFDKYKYDGYFQLIFDGTGLSNHDYNLNDNCLSRKHKNGVISYYKYVLECKLVVGNIVISLDTEFIENVEMNTENQKQDCETTAFKRMAKRIKKNYPKYKFLITGDGLYATDPIITICKNNKWSYIFNLKPDRLKHINDCFEGNIKLLNETTIKDYYLSTGIDYKNHILNVFKFIEKVKIEKKEKNKITKKIKIITQTIITAFRYITNLEVDDETIEELVVKGRKRWKIENEGFNLQKNGTFDITHLNSRDDNAMKAHYFFIQFAHTIRQLLEQGNILTKSLYLKIKEVSEFLLKALTSTISDLNFANTNFQLRFDT